MAKIVDLSNNEHWTFLKKFFIKLNKNEIKSILDAGSGKTSLNSLLLYFNNSHIDAVIFPGDDRKKNPIELNIISDRYKLMEKDLCLDNIYQTYDLVLAHLLLGEAIKWGNTFEGVLKSLLNIKGKYFIIVDLLEDNTIDYNLLEEYLLNNNFKIIMKKTTKRKKSVPIGNFVSKTFIGYLIEK